MTRRYLVVYGKCNGSNFAGHAPDVPGCISTGNTLEEMRMMMLEALTFHLEGTAEDGASIPEPFTTNVEFPESDFDGVEYYVVEHLNVPVPDQVNPVQRISSRLPQAA